MSLDGRYLRRGIPNIRIPRHRHEALAEDRVLPHQPRVNIIIILAVILLRTLIEEEEVPLHRLDEDMILRILRILAQVLQRLLPVPVHQPTLRHGTSRRPSCVNTCGTKKNANSGSWMAAITRIKRNHKNKPATTTIHQKRPSSHPTMKRPPLQKTPLPKLSKAKTKLMPIRYIGDRIVQLTYNTCLIHIWMIHGFDNCIHRNNATAPRYKSDNERRRKQPIYHNKSRPP